MDPVELSKRLGVSYVVAGELRSQPANLSVGVRLIDAQSGRIVWTDTFDRSLADTDTTATEKEVAAHIASSLGQPFGIIRSDIARSLPEEIAPSAESYECVLRGYYYRRTYSTALFEPLLACLNKAVRKDPGYAEAWAMLGFVHFITAAVGIKASDPAIGLDSATRHVRHGLELDPDSGLALKTLAGIEHYRGNYCESERLARQALDMNPNDPDALHQLGWRLAIRGRFDEGVPLIEQAIERTINPPGPYFHLLAVDRLMKGDGEAMLKFATRAAIDGSSISQSLIAMAYGLLGDREAGKRANERASAEIPEYDPIARFRSHQATDAILEAMKSALSGNETPD